MMNLPPPSSVSPTAFNLPRPLTARERELMAEFLRRGLKLPTPGQTEQASRYSPTQPTPKQRAFLALDCLEALYGGAAGGGKSEALLMAALQYVHVPGYAAILFRRTYADLSLPGALMDLSLIHI